MREKVRYEVDPFNRLIVKGARPSGLKKFRKVLNGRFKTGPDNSLYYEINKSQDIDIPQKIRLGGTYTLDKNHRLVYTLNKWNNQCEGNRLTLKTKLIDAKSNEIVFLVHSKESETKNAAYTMRLSGSWQADAHNRLSFGVERDRERLDALTLFGAWEVNKHNEIVYTYGKDAQNICFRGRWEITDRYRLSYRLDKHIHSGFDFTVKGGRIFTRGKKTSLVFDVSVGISKSKRIYRNIIFSGTWKMGDREFLVEGFPGEGMKLKFTKEILGEDGFMYLESSLKDKEVFIGGGLIFKW